METITIRFKAKRHDYGYSVPDIAPHHVVTPIPELGIRAHTWLSCSDEDVRKRRRVDALKRAGLDGYTVTEDDANNENVTIEPIGSGFMANVTITLEV